VTEIQRLARGPIDATSLQVMPENAMLIGENAAGGTGAAARAR